MGFSTGRVVVVQDGDNGAGVPQEAPTGSGSVRRNSNAKLSLFSASLSSVIGIRIFLVVSLGRDDRPSV